MVESRTSDGQTISQRADDVETVKVMLEKKDNEIVTCQYIKQPAA